MTASESSTPRGMTVTTTYLEITGLDGLRRVDEQPTGSLVLRAEQPTVTFYRFLYRAVGSTYNWTDRSHWSDEALNEYLLRPDVLLFVLYIRGVPAGYIELQLEADEPGTEIAYFGIMPEFQGRGLGKYLLSYGVRRAFELGAARVWLHTCSLDGPYALANYQARGFVAYKTTTHEQHMHV